MYYSNRRGKCVWQSILLIHAFLGIPKALVAQANNSEDTAAINLLLEKGQYEQNESKRMLMYKEAAKKSERIGYLKGAGSALLNIGSLFVNQGSDDSALFYCQLAYPYCSGLKAENSLLPNYYNIQGLICYNKSEYEAATQFFLKALAEETKYRVHSRQVVNMYTNLSLVYGSLQQFDTKLKYLGKAEEIARASGYDKELSLTLSNKGSTFYQLKRYAEASVALKEALSLARKGKNEDLELSCLVSLGGNLIDNGQVNEAIKYLNYAVRQGHELGYVRIEMAAEYFLGRAFQKQKQYAKAEQAIFDVIDKSRKINYLDLTNGAQFALSEVYQQMGKPEKALVYLQQAWELADSLSGVEKTKAISQMEIKYKTAEKDKQLAISNLQLAKQQRDIANKNLWIGGISAGVVILSLVLIGLYRADRHKQRMQNQQIRSLQQEQEIGILKAMMHGEENERGRIARELHDGIGGMLSATMMRFMSIRHKHEGLGNTTEYEEVLTLLEDMGGEIRKTAHNLMPEVLLKQGLPEAVRAFCNHIQSNGLQIDVQSYGNFEDLSHDFKLSTYRIIQELVQNILKHAKASHVLVQLMKHEEVFSITIEDDGVGFDSNAIRNGIGLHNLQTRVHNQSGRFTLESEEGKGTSVYIEFDIALAKGDPVSEV